MLGYFYAKKFGSKIAWANRKEGDLPAYEDGTEAFRNVDI